MNTPNLRSKFNLGLAVVGVVGGLLAVFLAAPLEPAGLHPSVLAAQAAAKQTVALLAPYAAVGALGAAVGLAELSSTFSQYPREAIATRWGQYLIWLNALAAILAYLVARIYAPAGVEPLMLILAVGVGFPTLIRTKFTLARQFGGGGEGDLSVDVGWIYEQFQNVCKKQIDLDLMTYRRSQVDRLLERYLTVQELYQTAVYTLNARATLSREEETAQLEELKRAIDPKVPAELARLNLGLFILELGGVAYVDLLARAKMQPRAVEPTVDGSRMTDEAVRKLTELPLPALTQKALDALTLAEDRQRVSSLAEPVPGLPEATQRASIARYLVDHVGAEAALRLVAGT